MLAGILAFLWLQFMAGGGAGAKTFSSKYGFNGIGLLIVPVSVGWPIPVFLKILPMKKTQISWIFLFVLIIIFPVVFSSRTQNSLVLVTSAILFFVLLLFFRLTVKVDDHFVRYIFGIGIIRGKYALENIESCRPVKDSFLGWGIKLRPEITILNVSGRFAIELRIRDEKKKVWIGTNHPDALSEYIGSKLTRPSGKQ